MKIGEVTTFQLPFSVVLKKQQNLHLTNFIEALYSTFATNNKKSSNSVENQSFS
jgi:hypothetical protein